VRRPNFFAGGTVDRLSHRRVDEPWLTDLAGSSEARVTLVWRSRSLVDNGNMPGAGSLPATALDASAGSSLIFLGDHGERAFFCLDVSHLEDPHRELDLDERLDFQDLRAMATLLEPEDGSLLAYARAMTTWHDRHRFCGTCGAATTSTQGGHLRRCNSPDCGAEIFPRTDPAVIMLVHDGGDSCLLGRQASWPAGVFSTLAGFVEPGEGLEDAVRREVWEEVGVQIEGCQYHSSQPWPFPSSIMLGFWATAKRGPVRVDGTEIEQAHWFDRRQILEREVRLPPPMSIARRLVDDWARNPGC
jgi:NAD+ diphosphatase